MRVLLLPYRAKQPGGLGIEIGRWDDKPVLGVYDLVVALSYDANQQDLSQFPARIPLS